MPYIKSRDRARALVSPMNAGELNFVLTMLVQNYLGDTPTYQDFNDALGALEGCKLELYARKIRPYEDTKILENGDVYQEEK